MSTRGFVGFKTNTKESRNGNIFGVFNHWDSYYSYLGEKVITLYQANTKEMFKKTFESINWTEDENCDTSVKPLGLLNGVYSNVDVVNECGFLNDGLFCEYAYLYNLENDTLELYRGFFDFPQGELANDLEYEKYNKNNNINYHTHHVFTITRNTHPSAIELLFNKMEDEKYDDMRNILIDGKYVEQIIMESLPDIFLS